MDQNTSIVWTFLFLAYKNGLLEKNLQLLNGVLDPHTDLGLVLASMEDSLTEADRAKINVLILDKALPMLKTITDEKFIEGTRILMDILQPALVRIVQNANYDVAVLSERLSMVVRLLLSLKPLTLLMAPAVIDLALAQKPRFSVRFLLRRLRKKIIKAQGEIR